MHVDAARGPRRVSGYAAAAGGIGFALLCALMWHSTRPTHWERRIIDRVDRLPVPATGLWVHAFEPVPFAVLVVVVGVGAALAGRRLLAFSGTAGCLAAVVAAQLVFKPLVDRTRTHVVGPYHYVIHVGSRMFPSSHVTAAASLATFLWLLFGARLRIAPLFALLPAIVGCAVIAEQLHYPADVLGGALLGPTVVLAVVGGAQALARVAERDDLAFRAALGEQAARSGSRSGSAPGGTASARR